MSVEQKVINVFLASTMLAKSLGEASLPLASVEVSLAASDFEDQLGSLVTVDIGNMGWEDIEYIINAAIRLANEFGTHMALKLSTDDPPYIFHQSLVLALMDLDRSLISIPPGMSADELSEDMMSNRVKLKKIYELIDEDPTLLDSTE